MTARVHPDARAAAGVASCNCRRSCGYERSQPRRRATGMTISAICCASSNSNSSIASGAWSSVASAPPVSRER